MLVTGERLPGARCRPGPYSNPEEIRRNLEVFYSEEPEDVARAKRICARCSIRDECLAAGVDEVFGLWGGLDPDERRNLRRNR